MPGRAGLPDPPPPPVAPRGRGAARAALGTALVDVGRRALDPADDFPDYAKQVAEAVSKGDVARGVLTCGTGLGMAYVAIRYPRVRAAVAWSPEIVELARGHNDANVLVL